MTAQHAAHPEAETPAETVGADRLLGVLGAGGCETAATLHAQHDLQGREDDAVCSD